MPGNFYTVTLEDVEGWPIPNYSDNAYQRTWLPIYAIVWAVVTSILVLGRLYLRITTKPGLDDLFLFFAWVFAIAFTAAACISVWDYDVGRHVWDVRPSNYVPALYWAWISQVLWMMSTGSVKTSVLLFYARMAKDYSRRWLWSVWILLTITVSVWIAAFFAYCFMCQPLYAYWYIHQMEALGESYTCINGDALTIAISVLTLASDIWTVALPCLMFQYHDLGVSKRQKIALNVIFSLGFFVTGAGVARTYYLWIVGHNEDLSWYGYDLFVSSAAECQLAIMCTCAPFLRAFFRRYLPNKTTNKTRSNATDTRTDTTNDDRPAINFSRPRTSVFQPVKSIFGRDEVFEMNLDNQTEKKGLLVLEEGTGRVLWNPTKNDYSARV